VVNARFAKPVDEALLAELAEGHELILTLEEHSLAGGFGSAVVERVSDLGLPVRVQRVGVADVLVHHDSQPSQRALFGLSAQAIAERLARALDPHQEIHR
jgi:1-deoxy-D-xylulose-5-phosphate synthase